MKTQMVYLAAWLNIAEKEQYAGSIVADRSAAVDLCPWAAEIIEVDGGYMCYESVTDAATALNQQ